MKNMWKVMAGAAAAVLLMSGCAASDQEIASSDVKPIDLDSVTPEENTMPITNEPITLSAITTSKVSVAGKTYSYNEIKAFQEMEKISGIKVDFQVVENERVNLMFASDDLPDLMLLNWGGIGGALTYAEDGQILALDDYMGKYAPNIVKYMKENRTVYPQMTEADGKMYTFPFIRGDQELRVFQGFQIRQDWLDKLNLEMPQTRDEFYSVLKAFKEQDPNGNGVADEVPYIAEKTFGIDRMYNFWGKDAFYVDNGTVKCGWTEPEFKEYVIWLNQLYQEGLIDPDYAITDKTQFDYKVSNELAGAWYGLAGGGLGRLMTLMEPVNPEFDIAGMPWLEADDGKKYVVNSEYVTEASTLGYAVSTQCKNVKEAVKWMDYAYSEEGIRLFNFGIEGESYTMENGVPTYTDLIVNNPQGLPMSEAIGLYAVPTGYPTLQSLDYFDQYMQPKQKAAIDVWKDADASRSIPSLKFTADESDNVNKKYNEIKSYHDEIINKFIVGKEPIENFDTYLSTIQTMGIEDVVKSYQAAYDRYSSLLNK